MNPKLVWGMFLSELLNVSTTKELTSRHMIYSVYIKSYTLMQLYIDITQIYGYISIWLNKLIDTHLRSLG